MRTKVVVVAGLGFGDEGKGTLVDALVQRTGAPLVVRYNGGAQAEHNVVMSDGRHHTFSQFGAGTLRGARTLLGPSVLIEPLALVSEAMHLRDLGVRDPFAMLSVDGDAPVITPYHRAANLVDERSRGASAHGSTGMGIGRTRDYSLRWPEDTLRARDLIDRDALRAKLELARDRLQRDLGVPFPTNFARVDDVARDFLAIGPRLGIVEHGWLEEEIEGVASVVFEGAQGVLLDQDHGFQPHTTWSDTTFGEAWSMVEDLDVEFVRFGVVRAYATRHGAGPLPTEGMLAEPEKHNHGGFAGAFRTGAFDLPLFNYAMQVVGGVDELAITHLDRRKTWPVCTSWGAGDQLLARALQGAPTFESQRELAEQLDALNPVLFERDELSGDALAELVDATCRSYGPTAEDKVFL